VNQDGETDTLPAHVVIIQHNGGPIMDKSGLRWLPTPSKLCAPVRVSHWFHNSVVIERGPLVFVLKIGQTWRQEKRSGPSKDGEVFPSTPWNYARSSLQPIPARLSKCWRRLSKRSLSASSLRR